ncbi:Sc15 protein [Ceratobasidium theobromae]|uniref:Sc15 protein n=1 Tax=Ceratobasidium theobromae TaxID=1582974 RepID=A0A5N5Q8T1_9AGAM|nr:Sc15 protein [Ceratobasidium theobromae]
MRRLTITVLLSYAILCVLQLVVATPVLSTQDLIVKRDVDNADVLAVFTKLNTTLAGILPKIDELVETQTATQSNVEPLIAQIVNALDTTSSELSQLEPVAARKRQSDDEVAQLVAGIITSLTTTLNGLLAFTSTIPLLGGLLSGVDTSLNQVLRGLSILLQGVLRLVANLLTNVAQLLHNLALGLSLGTLEL